MMNSFGPNEQDCCDGESSMSGDVFRSDTVQHDADQRLSFDDSTGDGSGCGSFMFDTMAGTWTTIPLTQQTAQVALDAVRYQKNYARSVTTRLCLHYINSIRTRKVNGFTSYIISVDGCEGTQIVATGRCNIDYCQPYMYELQLSQSSVGRTVFTVHSIYKTISQKSLIELRKDSNLDFSTPPYGDLGTIKPVEIPQQPAVWQSSGDGFVHGHSFEDEEPIAWAHEVNDSGESQPPISEGTGQPLSLRTESITMSASEPDNSAAAVAIVGITAVAVATVAFIAAFVVVQLRSLKKPSQRAVNRENSPLRSTLNTAENTFSMTSRGSVSAAVARQDVEKIEFFG